MVPVKINVVKKAAPTAMDKYGFKNILRFTRDGG
jgi:hypothetical protein